MNRYELIAGYAIAGFGAIQRGLELAPFLEWVDGELGQEGQEWPYDQEPAPRVLEIGSDAGGTLFCWRFLWPDATVVSVSLEEGPYATARPCEAHGATPIEGDSHAPATLELVQEVLGGEPIDLLFIDGDHSLNGCMADVLDYGPLLRPGGILALHDVSPHEYVDPPCEVDKVWELLAGEVATGSLTWQAPRVFASPEEPVWGGIGTLRKRAQVSAVAAR